jgi:asparagine synthase (glutamine-hydrolysing)
MCGIAGIYASGLPGEGSTVAAMVAHMAHRGPDGDGFHTDSDIALGMCRLAIIDPEHGQQPLRSEDGSIVVVFNGELYNHLDLRRWLESRGHLFASGSDGEVLPHLYEELGDGLVERLNGIFAFALWDSQEKRLLLARDRFGVKPLYVFAQRRRVAFASELKGLLADSRVPREVDPAAVDLFLTFRFTPSPKTLLRGVEKLEPATLLSVSADELRKRRYWGPTPSFTRMDRRNLVEEYREAVERAVVRQMMSDRPIGVMLSGGVDSGAITAILAQHAPRVRTFTIGFADGGDADETPLAERTARMFGTEHHSLVVSPAEYRADLARSLTMVEEPVGSSSALAVNHIAQLMRPHVPVALCGQGADELHGGYRRHLGLKLATELERLERPLRLVGRLPGLARNVRMQRGLATLGQREPLARLMAAYALLDAPAKQRLYGPAMADGSSASYVERFRQRVEHLDVLSQMLYVDTRLWLPDELLLIADKMSMAASVELRVPFLDNDVVDLVEEMDSSQKVRGLQRKSIHKRAMLKWLPSRVVYRRERGWATPMSTWLRHDLLPLLEDALFDRNSLSLQLFRHSELRRIIDEHVASTADRTRELFCLFSLELWHSNIVRPQPTRVPVHTPARAQ